MKRGTPDHPKTLDFAERIQAYLAKTSIPLPIDICQSLACGILERLWHFTGRYARRGDIGRHSDAAIAKAAGWSYLAADLVAALVESHWLDPHHEHRLIVHDWPEHADDATDKLLRDRGESYADGTPTRRSQKSRRDETGDCRDKAQGSRDKTAKSRASHSHSLSHSLPPLTPPGNSEGEEASAAPPTDAQADPTPDTAEAEQQLAIEVRALGATNGAGAIAEARSHGTTLAEIRGIVAVYRSKLEPKPGAWGPGALDRRIRQAQPGENPAMLWPEPDPLWVKKTKTVQGLAGPPVLSAEQRRAKNQAEAKALESQFGPVLDAMDRDAAMSVLPKAIRTATGGAKWPLEGPARSMAIACLAEREKGRPP